MKEESSTGSPLLSVTMETGKTDAVNLRELGSRENLSFGPAKLIFWTMIFHC